jgi:hypothetical protein
MQSLYLLLRLFIPVTETLIDCWSIVFLSISWMITGVYECQVPSVNDSKLSLGVKLKVVGKYLSFVRNCYGYLNVRTVILEVPELRLSKQVSG